jgi:hypothetical protein
MEEKNRLHITPGTGRELLVCDANPRRRDPTAVDRQHVGCRLDRIERHRRATVIPDEGRDQQQQPVEQTDGQPRSALPGERGSHGCSMPDDLETLRSETDAAHWNQKGKSEVHVRPRTLSVIIIIVAIATIAITLEPRLSAQHAVRRPIDGRPNALIDLRTPEGVRMVKGQWRYSDTRIVEADFEAPGPDIKPSGKPIKTYDYVPKAGSIDFDDSKWEAIEPAALEMRRATGKLCFNWYRTSITIPERVGAFETAGSTVVFELDRSSLQLDEPRAGRLVVSHASTKHLVGVRMRK